MKVVAIVILIPFTEQFISNILVVIIVVYLRKEIVVVFKTKVVSSLMK